METKFIEGTNEQYSIREDGVVIQHYKYTWKGNITYSLKNKYVKVYKNNQVYLVSKTKRLGVTINTLLKNHFGTYICVSCKKIYKCKNVEFKCNTCKKKQQRISNKIAKERHKSLITKSLVANHLRCHVSDITDEIHICHKEKVLLKRQIAKDYKVNIQKIVEF